MKIKKNAWDAWWNEHPKACKKCNATGIITCSDSVPYGSTTASFETDDYCMACIQNGVCPVCGQILVWNDENEYFLDCSCGWHDQFRDDSVQSVHPPIEPGCYCNDSWEY